jgi:hypothetical protein
MKIIKKLFKLNITNESDLVIKNTYLYLIGILGINYILLNDILFIRALEYCLFYNKLSDNKNIFGKLLNNKLANIFNGWFIELQITGLGYRVKINELGYLFLNLGYSHAFAIKVPKGINLLINKDKILLFSSDLILLNHFISNIMRLKPIDVYKGKGINFIFKTIKLKEGKKQKL